MSEALLRALQRAALNALVRRFFAERDVLEVETPILSVAGNTEPNIDSFHTDFTGHVDAGGRRRWLRTSPEYPLKRLLAAGVGDCYELGRVFRNGEAGVRHNPEFTMLGGTGSAGTTTGWCRKPPAGRPGVGPGRAPCDAACAQLPGAVPAVRGRGSVRGR